MPFSIKDFCKYGHSIVLVGRYKNGGCKECMSLRNKTADIKKVITLELYNQMYSTQLGCCKICGKHQSTFKNRLSIDHCHKTGRIRGLLCIRCNQGVSFYEDSLMEQKFNDYIKEFTI